MRRALPLWLGSAALILALVNSPVSSGSRQICIPSGNGSPGTRVALPLSLHEGAGVAGFQVDIQYDADLLSFAGARLGSGTTAAGNWSVLSAAQGVDVVRVLGVSGSGVGLSPGFKEIALLDFDIAGLADVGNVPFALKACVLSDELGVAIPCEACLAPGVEAAFPRFRGVLADDGLSFAPDPAVIEQGDWVLWRNLGSIQAHTSTSGVPCAASGLWDGGLSPGQQFARQFPEGPGPLPYFCTPHCAAGHDGTVVVTDPILLAVEDLRGLVGLSWTGGSGLYRVFRSPNPRFVGTGQVELVPDGGPSGTTLTDSPALEIGEAAFYHVSNQ